ncbi:hypothetical protein T265_04744 [Opisthorchis viverrini]|uniref:Uncharacterized protein n=1 Tax=Opisthorchis viverrini TaxID=6198 RepID=A0A074ZM31_OPIVI|nr:hypothetical protein T265_04744 [Opisthorchis viverrini]KER28438.1 hypothetical protein T265_04744 [Opisthorchis viverrini]
MVQSENKQTHWLHCCWEVIKLSMAVPCHHWPDMLQSLDSHMTDVTFEMIRLGPVEETGRNETDMGLSLARWSRYQLTGSSKRALPKFKAWEDEVMEEIRRSQIKTWRQPGRGNKLVRNRYWIVGFLGPLGDPGVVDHWLGGVDIN